MRTGSAMAAGQGGFTYLLLLFAIALGGVGLAALGEQAQQRERRERETELRYRGDEIARALGRYVAASPAGTRQPPPDVEALLEDRRSGQVLRHLRALRPDPLGGGWVWLRAGEGGCSARPLPGTPAPGLVAVRSSSPQALLRRTGERATPACDLVFRAPPMAAPTPSPNGS